MVDTNINKDFKRGKIGEDKIIDFLSSHKSTLQLIDVSYDKWFQQCDVDLLQITNNGINKIEIKTDFMAHRTGNLAYETTSCKYTNTIGCFEKTCADYIFYYIINTNVLYIFDTLELRQWVEDNKDNLKLIEMGDMALGYLIKLNKLKNIATIINLNT